MIPGTGDYSPGDLRISFLVVDNGGRLIAPPRARFWIARPVTSTPFQETVAHLERVGVAGVSQVQDAPALYVAHVHVTEPGTYSILARPIGHVSISGIRDATPRYCESRTCGPVVDVVDQVRRRFTGTAIRFIHVEIYRDNDPRKGENRWVREWHLPSEPWTFLVGRDGRIKGKFEGAVSSRELDLAVRRLLQ